MPVRKTGLYDRRIACIIPREWRDEGLASTTLGLVIRIDGVLLMESNF
jgi:hypothetical protein